MNFAAARRDAQHTPTHRRAVYRNAQADFAVRASLHRSGVRYSAIASLSIAALVSTMSNSRFGTLGGGAQKCSRCGTSVYVQELIEYDKQVFHQECFKCLECKSTLDLKSVAMINGALYCKNCFKRIFLTAGKYSDFGEKAESRQKSASVFEPPAHLKAQFNKSQQQPGANASLNGSSATSNANPGSPTRPMSRSFDMNAQSNNSSQGLSSSSAAGKLSDSHSALNSVAEMSPQSKQKSHQGTFKPVAFHISHQNQSAHAHPEVSPVTLVDHHSTSGTSPVKSPVMHQDDNHSKPGQQQSGVAPTPPPRSQLPFSPASQQQALAAAAQTNSLNSTASTNATTSASSSMGAAAAGAAKPGLVSQRLASFSAAPASPHAAAAALASALHAKEQSNAASASTHAASSATPASNSAAHAAAAAPATASTHAAVPVVADRPLPSVPGGGATASSAARTSNSVSPQKPKKQSRPSSPGSASKSGNASKSSSVSVTPLHTSPPGLVRIASSGQRSAASSAKSSPRGKATTAAPLALPTTSALKFNTQPAIAPKQQTSAQQATNEASSSTKSAADPEWAAATQKLFDAVSAKNEKSIRQLVQQHGVKLLFARQHAQTPVEFAISNFGTRATGRMMLELLEAHVCK